MILYFLIFNTTILLTSIFRFFRNYIYFDAILKFSFGFILPIIIVQYDLNYCVTNSTMLTNFPSRGEFFFTAINFIHIYLKNRIFYYC